MLEQITQIAREAGALLREGFGRQQTINKTESHDIKLQMDVDCQRLIENRLLKLFPDHSIVGEENSQGDPRAEHRWIIDPLDGTVNYTYGLPHFCVSIALQRRQAKTSLSAPCGGYESVLGVIYDPMRDEIFTAGEGKGARLNGRPLRVSDRTTLGDAIISVGFAKSAESIENGLRNYQTLVRRVRKVRTWGSAALDLAYIAAGRMEAYYETQIQIWDIAAGILMVQEAGGTVKLDPLSSDGRIFSALVSNGKVDILGALRST